MLVDRFCRVLPSEPYFPLTVSLNIDSNVLPKTRYDSIQYLMAKSAPFCIYCHLHILKYPQISEMNETPRTIKMKEMYNCLKI